MIPGPAETEELYQMRMNELTAAPKAFQTKYPKRIIEVIDGFPVYIGRKGLKPWEAGALWVYEGPEKVRVPLIQLKKRNAEILAHEKIHAQRIAFDEKRFEEIFAYLSSKKRWRRILGPLFRNRASVWLFIIFSLLPIFEIGFIFAPLGLLGLEGLRLLFDRKRLMNVIKKLGSLEQALYLTDKEIIAFSKISKEKMLMYIKSQASSNLRICKLLQLMS